MNILFLNHYAGSRKRGMEYRTYYLAREWVKRGHQVCICAASYSHLRPESKDAPVDYKEDGIDYVWVPTPSYQRNMARGVNNLAYSLRSLTHLKHISSKMKPDVIIGSSPHPFTVFNAFLLSKMYRAPWIFEVRDLWPLTMIEIAKMSPYHPFLLLMGMAERFGYKYSASTVSLLPTAFGYMASKGLSEGKFHWVPTGISVADWKMSRSDPPREHGELLQQLHAMKKFVVGYVGALGPANNVTDLISAAHRMTEDSSIAFVIVGSGPMKQQYLDMIKAPGVKNVHFLPVVPRECLPSLLSQMDILYFGVKKSGLYKHGTSSNKMCDYMMAAKPVIYGVETPFDIVKDSQCGLSVPSEDPAAIAAAILELKALSQEDRQRMGMNGYQYIMKNYDYEVLAQRMEKIMESIIANHRATLLEEFPGPNSAVSPQ